MKSVLLAFLIFNLAVSIAMAFRHGEGWTMAAFGWAYALICETVKEA